VTRHSVKLGFASRVRGTRCARAGAGRSLTLAQVRALTSFARVRALTSFARVRALTSFAQVRRARFARAVRYRLFT
jgi:hypothetical protein